MDFYFNSQCARLKAGESSLFLQTWYSFSIMSIAKNFVQKRFSCVGNE